ncbi:hypothetical protein MAPG_06640 [Magnaporthiopsis poae ATCC 64411]|uniref:Uncharacterized protein n=1 Tax=Magnaporthiopsis poae (strain ATCC 64411 / 73-15) TaxID=644358 RepID=A0A0C4E2J9_MAGP6|nr:hypothetical protein MAPG_06640 [Magnaporthiopsis poae ATCC 64411]
MGVRICVPGLRHGIVASSARQYLHIRTRAQHEPAQSSPLPMMKRRHCRWLDWATSHNDGQCVSGGLIQSGWPPCPHCRDAPRIGGRAWSSASLAIMLARSRPNEPGQPAKAGGAGRSWGNNAARTTHACRLSAHAGSEVEAKNSRARWVAAQTGTAQQPTDGGARGRAGGNKDGWLVAGWWYSQEPCHDWADASPRQQRWSFLT